MIACTHRLARDFLISGFLSIDALIGRACGLAGVVMAKQQNRANAECADDE